MNHGVGWLWIYRYRYLAAYKERKQVKYDTHYTGNVYGPCMYADGNIEDLSQRHINKIWRLREKKAKSTEQRP